MRSTTPPERAHRRRGPYIALALAAAALALVAACALPAYPFVDETEVVAEALHMDLAGGGPLKANWPPHTYDLLRAEWGLLRALGVLGEPAAEWQRFQTGWYEGVGPLHIASRLLALGCALALVWVSYRMARLFVGRSAAAAAALCAAASPLLLRYSCYMLTDMPHALWTAVALYCALRLGRHKHLGTAFLGGFATSMAVATKYLGGLAALPLVLAWALPAAGGRRARWGSRGRLLGGGLLIFAGAAAGVLAGMHEVLRDPQPYWDWLRLHQSSKEMVWLGFEGAPAPHLYAASVILPHAAGSWPLFVLAVLGLVPLVRRRRAESLLLLVFLGPYFFIVGGNSIRYARYFLPWVPCLALLIGGSYSAALERLGRRDRWRVAAALALAILLAIPFLRALGRARAAGAGDTRFAASERLQEDLAEGSGLVTIQPRVPPQRDFHFLHNPAYPRIQPEPLEIGLAQHNRQGEPRLWFDFLARYLAAHPGLSPAALQSEILGRLGGEPGEQGVRFSSAEHLYRALLQLGMDRFLWSEFSDGIYAELGSQCYPQVQRFLELVQRNELLWRLDPGGQRREDLPLVELESAGSARRGASVGGPELRLYRLVPLAELERSGQGSGR